jgi:hypothetical protein
MYQTFRWSERETIQMLVVYSALQQKLSGSGRVLWHDVAAEMYKLRIDRSPDNCANKFKNMKKCYLQSTHNGSVSSRYSKTCWQLLSNIVEKLR